MKATTKNDADSLAIAGLVPLSTVDWPGKLAATVFLQGCPLSCSYCHNEAIIDPRVPGVIPWQDVENLLEKRKGLLDAVVLTGGEALRQAGVVDAARRIRKEGFEVGLHTSGVYPTRLREILEYVDWIGYDIKAAPGDYADETGVAVGEKVWESLKMLLEAVERRPFLQYEVRMTVYPGAPAEQHFENILEDLRGMGVTTFALQEARTEGTPVQFRADSLAWDRKAWKKRLASMEANMKNAGFKECVLRMA